MIVVYLYSAWATLCFLNGAWWLFACERHPRGDLLAWLTLVAVCVLWPLSTVIGVVRAVTGKAGRS